MYFSLIFIVDRVNKKFPKEEILLNDIQRQPFYTMKTVDIPRKESIIK